MRHLALSMLVASACVVRPMERHVDVVAVLVQGEGVRILEPGGERLVPGTVDVDTFAWDRGGERLLVTHGGRLERVAADGGRELVLELQGTLRFPDARGRDGAIAVAAQRTGETAEGAWELLLVEPDGSVRELGPGYDPCFAASGDAVLCEAFDGATTAIWRLDLASGARVRLADGHTPAASPSGEVVFSRGGHLWRLDPSADPVAEQELTRVGDYDRFASVSPDGARIVFFRQDDGRDSIVERELATGVERTLVEGRVMLAAYRPPR